MASVYSFKSSPKADTLHSNKPYRTDVLETYEERISGRGIGIKPAFAGKKYITVKGIPKILQSLYVILSTPRGSRFFNPDFGSRIHLCLFEPNDFVFKDLVEYYVSEDIAQWEPRVNAKVTCHLHLGTNKADLEILFNLKGDQGVYSYVYPLTRDIPTLE